jgi:hypothetical protein
MPPEQPPFLLILDTSFGETPLGAADLKGRIEYLQPKADRLFVRWGVGSPPAGYKEEGGGVVFVAGQSANSKPPDENPPIGTIAHNRYVYEDGLDKAEWLMLVMILPRGFILGDPRPEPAGSRMYADRLAVYWRLRKYQGPGEIVHLEWGLRKGDVGEALRTSPPRSPFPFDLEVPEFATFLSYRKDDRWAVGRITDRLTTFLGARAVFRDIHSIELGADFRHKLDDAVGRCKVMLPIIGSAWLDPPKPIGERRIDSSKDWVRVEIESALQRHRSVIPVLLDDTQILHEESLPDSLRQLSFLQACRLRESTFDADMGPLVNSLRKSINCWAEPKGR